MYIISKMKGIYKGPQHYWNQYSLVPREKYYYSYYGMYGPDTDLTVYSPVEEVSHTHTIENFCGINSSSFLSGILYIIIAWFLLKFLGIM